MAARPTPSEQGSTRKRSRSPPDDSSGSAWRAPHTLPFGERKPVFLRAMYNQRTEIFKQETDKRLSHVNETIGGTYKVALADSTALAFLEDYLDSPDSAADAKAYIHKVMNSKSAVFQDVGFTYEHLLKAHCPDKSTLIPWDGRVPRNVPIGTALEKEISDVTKVRNAISLYGSSGCGKSEALKAVAEYIIKHHHFPNVFRLHMKWRGEADLTYELDQHPQNQKKIDERDGNHGGAQIPSDERKEKEGEVETVEWTRNCRVAKRLLEAVDSKIGRSIANEVERDAPLPDPTQFALVVTLDEIGYVPTSARALVSISRQLNGDGEDTEVPPAVLTLRKVFGHVVIVMAGTSGETMTGGVGGSDPSMVCSVNLDDVQKTYPNGSLVSREAYREALVCAHLPSKTHGPWLAARLLNSRLRLALDNPRVVSLVAKMTTLVLPDVGDRTVETNLPSVPSGVPNPLSLHEFDQWAPLLANAYCKLNGLGELVAIAEEPCAYSQRHLVFLRAHYVWDHGAELRRVLDGLLAKENTPGTAFSKEEQGLFDLQRKGLVTFTRDDKREEAASSCLRRPSYRLSIPPSLPYIALAALDCIAGFGGGGWSAWESVAMQSVGLRYASAMAWKGCATVGDAVPELYVHVTDNDLLAWPVTDKNPLTWPVASVGNTGSAWAGRHWCAVVAPIQLCGYAVKEFNRVKGEEAFKKSFLDENGIDPTPQELEVGMKKAKEVFDATQAKNKQAHNDKVCTYWKDQVLPLLEKHSIVLVQNAEKAPAADCFALIRVDRTSAGKPIRADEELDGKPLLLVAQLQMKDFSYSTAPNVDEEMAKMGFYNDEKASRKGVATTASRKVVNEICQWSTDHRKIMEAAFPKYKLFFGAVICMSRAEPEPTLKHSWNSLGKLQEELKGKGVMFATPVLQRVLYPSDAPADTVTVN